VPLIFPKFVELRWNDPHEEYNHMQKGSAQGMKKQVKINKLNNSKIVISQTLKTTVSLN
jgi:hypothetical protein